jgi:DNA-binding NarL/FixJ family response regulator
MEEKIERRGRPRKKKPNGNQIDMEMRLREILKKLGKGKGRKEIEEDLKRDYGVSDATIRNDFIRAFKHLKANQDVFTKNIRELITERYELLWKMALEKNDYKAATQILKQMADEFGLNVQKSEISIKDTEFKITFE